MERPPINLAVLVSGSGFTLQNLLDQIGAHRLKAAIRLVVASRPNLLGEQRAIKANIPSAVVDRKSFVDVEAFGEAVWNEIDKIKVDLVCLAGWLCLLPIPARYVGRVINIHPSLLPKFGGKGMYGLRVHQAVIDQQQTISGCTVHFVDDQYDNGPVILQRECPVLPDDTAQTLAARVFELEKIALPDAIRLFAEGRIHVNGRFVKISPR